MNNGVHGDGQRWVVTAMMVVVMIFSGACASGESSGTTAVQLAEAATESEAESNDATPDETERAGAPDAADQDDQVSDQPAADGSSPTAVFVSPIGEALGVAQDELATAFDTYAQDAEELVRQCMADAGFDYTPIENGIDRAGRRQAELSNSLPLEQFTEEYGFGIATLFELNFKDEGVIDFVNQQFGPPPDVERSSGEQAAFDIALNGETIQGLDAEDAQEQLFGSGPNNALEGSCRDYGYSNAENPGAVYDGLFSLLGDEVNALNDRFDSDARIRDALAEWQTCMATSGHSYENRFEIFDELQTQAGQLANQYLSSPQILTALGKAQEVDFVSMNAEDRTTFLEDVGALQGFAWVPKVQAEFDDLIAFELRVAADSQACADEKLFEQVQFELETEFVETHADQLALLAAGAE